MFEEVEIVPPEETWGSEVRALADAEIAQRQISVERFAKTQFNAMRDAIARAWEPDKFHFIHHSAGWDTRMMTMTLWSLYQERGDDWLGDVLFVECANEAKEARRIVREVGWDESLFVVYNEGAPPDEYHARSLNFETAWERTDGGMRAYPFNMWWDVPEWAQEEGLIPDDEVQYWSAFSANNAVNAAVKNRLGESFLWQPYNALSAVPLKGDWVFPYTDLEFMKTLAKVGRGQHPRWSTFVSVVVLSPEVGMIENPYDVRYRELSDELYEMAVRDYLGSAFGRAYPYVGSSQEIEHCMWWGYWGLASLCEKLLAEGYKIRKSEGGYL
jgi:hypothetical protein